MNADPMVAERLAGVASIVHFVRSVSDAEEAVWLNHHPV